MEPEAGDVWVECDGQQVQGGGGAGHPEGSVVTPGRGDIKIEEGIKEAIKGALEEVMGGGRIKVPINGHDSLKD